ncbi:MAG: hypothetical protein HY001_03120 [Candidatus Portnoybacteria bacterium]|nr:hypothetical protein [Candidatus Portnoybacteria bacterium]
MGIKKTILNFVLSLRDFILPYTPLLELHRYDFAFLVHPRNIHDVYKKYPILRHFPIRFTEGFLRFFWPVTVAKIKGPYSLKTGRMTAGILISIPLTAQQILENKTEALKHVSRACHLAQKLGVRVIGLGAFTSSISEGGLLLRKKVKANLTNGNSLTVANSIISIEYLIKERNLESKKIHIAVVGATGSIGAAISQLLLIHGFFHLILIGNTPLHVQELRERFQTFGAVKDGNVSFTTNLEEISKADIIIMAVSKENIINDSALLKRGVVIYDISQPKGINRDILKGRNDVILFDGGLTKTPEINFPIDVGFPPEVTFSCLAETMLLAAEKIQDDFIGKVDLMHAEKIMSLAKKYNFTSYHIPQ